MFATLTTKSHAFSVKGLFDDKLLFIRKRMNQQVREPPYVNPRSRGWVEGVRNAPPIDSLPDPEADLPEHEKKAYLQLLTAPPFDNSTEGGSRGKSVISQPEVVELTNRLYHHLGLENVKSRGGRGGEGAVGHKLHFQDIDLNLPVGNVEELRRVGAVLRTLQDKATGKVALRIKRDLAKINGVLERDTAPVLASSSSDEEAPPPPSPPRRVPIVEESSSDEEEEVKYTLEAGKPHSLHTFTYNQLVPIAEKLGISLATFPNKSGVAKKLKQAIIAKQKAQ